MSSFSERALREAFTKGYRVDVDGRVISPRGKFISSPLTSAGYPGFSSPMVDGRRVTLFVHRLAALQKFGEAIFEQGIEVRHRDGDTLNSRPNNLLLGSRSDNEMDKAPEVRRKAGLAGKPYAAAASVRRRKLTAEQVIWARQQHEMGVALRKLARSLQISRDALTRAVMGASYAEV